MKTRKKHEYAAPLLVVTAGACWGFIGFFTKRLSAIGFSAIQIGFLRVASAAVLIWIYILLFERRRSKISLKDTWMFFGTGVLSITLFSILYFTTIQLTAISFAVVLLYTAPCFVMILSAIFFREKIGAVKISALVLAFIGCLCTTGLVESLIGGTGLGRVSKLGILTGIGSGLGYALYSIFGTAALKKYDTVTVTAYTFLFASAALLPFSIDREFFILIKRPDAIANTAGITLLSTILPYLLYTQGLKYTEPGKASILAFSEPLVATLTGLIIFHEKLTAGGIAGMFMIFASIVILGLKNRRTRVSDAQQIAGNERKWR
ncbi:MAG: EamA family transporter [Oscillospiraceae bacterium]|nr:EamA family transporter [Oscillospiraceae bacterium]